MCLHCVLYFSPAFFGGRRRTGGEKEIGCYMRAVHVLMRDREGPLGVWFPFGEGGLGRRSLLSRSSALHSGKKMEDGVHSHIVLYKSRERERERGWANTQQGGQMKMNKLAVREAKPISENGMRRRRTRRGEGRAAARAPFPLASKVQERDLARVFIARREGGGENSAPRAIPPE